MISITADELKLLQTPELLRYLKQKAIVANEDITGHQAKDVLLFLYQRQSDLHKEWKACVKKIAKALEKDDEKALFDALIHAAGFIRYHFPISEYTISAEAVFIELTQYNHHTPLLEKNRYLLSLFGQIVGSRLIETGISNIDYQCYTYLWCLEQVLVCVPVSTKREEMTKEQQDKEQQIKQQIEKWVDKNISDLKEYKPIKNDYPLYVEPEIQKAQLLCFAHIHRVKPLFSKINALGKDTPIAKELTKWSNECGNELNFMLENLSGYREKEALHLCHLLEKHYAKSQLMYAYLQRRATLTLRYKSYLKQAENTLGKSAKLPPFLRLLKNHEENINNTVEGLISEEKNSNTLLTPEQWLIYLDGLYQFNPVYDALLDYQKKAMELERKGHTEVAKAMGWQIKKISEAMDAYLIAIAKNPENQQSLEKKLHVTVASIMGKYKPRSKNQNMILLSKDEDIELLQAKGQYCQRLIQKHRGIDGSTLIEYAEALLNTIIAASVIIPLALFSLGKDSHISFKTKKTKTDKKAERLLSTFDNYLKLSQG